VIVAIGPRPERAIPPILRGASGAWWKADAAKGVDPDRSRMDVYERSEHAYDLIQAARGRDCGAQADQLAQPKHQSATVGPSAGSRSTGAMDT
jgi:hypothetical protein